MGAAEPATREPGQDFIRDIVKARPGRREAQDGGDALPAGAQRLPAHRPRQVHLPQLRHRPGVRRTLPPALRRYQPHQGGAGVHRRHRGRRALAGLRLGQAPLPRLRLLRDALRVGRAPDRGRQGLRGRPEPGGDAGEPGHPHRARQEQPLPRPLRRGEPRPVPPHAGRRVPQRRPRAARQDRYGLGQHQPARSRPLPHPARHPPAHRRQMVHLPELRLRPRPVGRHRAHHPLHLHAGVRGPPAALRLVHREPARSLAPAPVRVRAAEHHLHGAVEARADPAGAGRSRVGLGRSAHAHHRRPAPARRAAGRHPRLRQARGRRQGQQHGRLRHVRVQRCARRSTRRRCGAWACCAR